MGVLTQKQEALLLLFKNAIGREKEAQAMYKEMLPLNDDPALKSIIETFIAQEKEHEETLVKMYNELRKTGDFKGLQG